MTPTSVCEEDDGDVGDDGKHTSKRTSEYHVVLLPAAGRHTMRHHAFALFASSAALCANAPDKMRRDARESLRVDAFALFASSQYMRHCVLNAQFACCKRVSRRELAVAMELHRAPWRAKRLTKASL